MSYVFDLLSALNALVSEAGAAAAAAALAAQAAAQAAAAALNVAPPDGSHFFWMSGTQAAVGSQFAHVQFVNPADSGHNIRVTQVGMITTTATSNGFCYGYRAATVTPITGAVESAGTANWADFRLDETTSPFKVYTASNVANLVAGRPVMLRKFLGTNLARVDSCEIILPPGSSVVFVGQLAATELRVSLEGYAWTT